MIAKRCENLKAFSPYKDVLYSLDDCFRGLPSCGDWNARPSRSASMRRITRSTYSQLQPSYPAIHPHSDVFQLQPLSATTTDRSIAFI